MFQALLMNRVPTAPCHAPITMLQSGNEHFYRWSVKRSTNAPTSSSVSVSSDPREHFAVWQLQVYWDFVKVVLLSPCDVMINVYSRHHFIRAAELIVAFRICWILFPFFFFFKAKICFKKSAFWTFCVNKLFRNEYNRIFRIFLEIVSLVDDK